ncbi:MAG: fluoride efflux transporter CrcB [Acidobacteriota bacterium]
MIEVFLVGLGGFFGAVARYLLGGWVQRHADLVSPGFPLGTFAVNVAGSFALGVLLAASARLPDEARLLLGVGVLGAFTTFSTFSAETLDLLRRDAFGLAAFNVAASVTLGLAAAWLGLVAGRWVTGGPT